MEAHHLSYQTLHLSNIGFRNQIWIGDTAILKVYGENNQNGYALESWFYETVHPEYAPKLLGKGKMWILLERISGEGLFRLWRTYTDAQREDAVRQIAAIACAINHVPWEGAAAFLPHSEPYGAALLDCIRTRYHMLMKNNWIKPELAAQAYQYVQQNIGVFDDEKLYLVYNDLHFDNLIVHDDGKIFLLDYEMMAIAPKDLVLDVWQRMLIHPFTYANEEDHPLTKPEDYSKLLCWMQKYAPELFMHPDVRKRVILYGIQYEFDILCEFPLAEGPMERIAIYLKNTLW